MHPTGPMLAFQLNIPEIFSEALASPAYMVATPMNGNSFLKLRMLSETFKNGKH